MILVSIDAITQYILSLTPAVTALIGVIVVIAVGVGKVKNALKDNGEVIERTSGKNTKVFDEIVEQNKILRKENIELKKALTELNKKLEIIDTIKAVKKE